MGAGGDAGAEESQRNQDVSARDKRPTAPRTEPSSWLVWHPSEGWFLLAGSLLHHCYLLVYMALPTSSPEGETHLQGEAAPSCGPQDCMLFLLQVLGGGVPPSVLRLPTHNSLELIPPA